MSQAEIERLAGVLSILTSMELRAIRVNDLDMLDKLQIPLNYLVDRLCAIVEEEGGANVRLSEGDAAAERPAVGQEG